jgi:hypothetical protein
MTQFPGSFPSEFRPSPSSPSLSSLSPLAAPFTAGGRPLASDPIHNPASLGPTAPTMLQSSQHQGSIPADAFTFASGNDGIGAGAVPYYQPYEPWKPSWAPDVRGDGSGSWIDPSHGCHVSSMDKGIILLPNNLVKFGKKIVIVGFSLSIFHTESNYVYIMSQKKKRL